MTIKQKLEYIYDSLTAPSAVNELGKEVQKELIRLYSKLEIKSESKLNQVEYKPVSVMEIEQYKDTLRKYHTEIMDFSEPTLRYFTEIIKLLGKRNERALDNAFGNYIKATRKIKNITSEELAAKSNVSKGYINRIENGLQQNPSLNIIMKLAESLDIEISILLEKLGIEISPRIEFDDLVNGKKKLFYRGNLVTSKQLVEIERILLNKK